MKELGIYISESFYNNIGIVEQREFISKIPDVISSSRNIKQIEKIRWKSDMYKSDVYKFMYPFFNDNLEFTISYDTFYPVQIYDKNRGVLFDKLTVRFTFARKGNKFRYTTDSMHEKYTDLNAHHEYDVDSVNELLSCFCVYLPNAKRFDILRKSVNVIV